MSTNPGSMSEAQRYQAQRILKETTDRVMTFGVAIARRDDRENGWVAGSGTLVTMDGRFGMLTAFHVLRELDGKADLALIVGLTDSVSPIPFPFENSMRLRIAFDANSDEGPDLGSLLFPAPIVSSVRAVAAFYTLNLEPRRSTNALAGR